MRSRPIPSRRASSLGILPAPYDIYGPRVPAIVVSPYAKPQDVTDVVHDHTSVLATIEAKWNYGRSPTTDIPTSGSRS